MTSSWFKQRPVDVNVDLGLTLRLEVVAKERPQMFKHHHGSSVVEQTVVYGELSVATGKQHAWQKPGLSWE